MASIFNANVCVAPARKIWFGDLDLTTDEPKLWRLAELLGETVYVLYEHDGRFRGRDDAPAIDRAVFSATPAGVITYADSIQRRHDERLHRAPPKRD